MDSTVTCWIVSCRLCASLEGKSRKVESSPLKLCVFLGLKLIITITKNYPWTKTHNNKSFGGKISAILDLRGRWEVCGSVGVVTTTEPDSRST